MLDLDHLKGQFNPQVPTIQFNCMGMMVERVGKSNHLEVFDKSITNIAFEYRNFLQMKCPRNIVNPMP